MVMAQLSKKITADACPPMNRIGMQTATQARMVLDRTVTDASRFWRPGGGLARLLHPDVAHNVIEHGRWHRPR